MADDDPGDSGSPDAPPAVMPAGTIGRGLIGPIMTLGTDLVPVHEMATPASSIRARGSFQIINWGPGNLVDFKVCVTANDRHGCPMTSYLGPDNVARVNGFLTNDNVLFTSPDDFLPMAPNASAGQSGGDVEDAGMLTFYHQYYGRIRLYLAADQANTIIQIWASC